MNVLIVDDNPQMRRLIGRIIEDVVEQTFECSDGGQALESYRQDQPDWVLMDLKMYEMGGLSATRQIKASYPEAKIIIVTNYDDRDFRKAAREAGACAYVVKENLFELKQILTSFGSTVERLMP